MSNITGKVYAMNALTPMKPWKTPILRLFFFILGRFPSMQADLIRLSFIQFARWVIIPRKRFPYLGSDPVGSDPGHEQQPESLRYDYLLFFSNFNGTWNQYIDAFSAVLSRGLNLIWRWSEKFPGAVPVTPFKQYIAGVQFETDYYYTAYPQATANDVKSAHIVQDALTRLRDSFPTLQAEEFREHYLQFVLAVQAHLGEPGEAPTVF